jgi:hypothetical protein
MLLPTTSRWTGTLTYLDYTSNDQRTIPSTLLVTRAGEAAWNIAIGYDEEPHANSSANFSLERNGSTIVSGDERLDVVSRESTAEGVRIVARTQGEDDKRPATIEKVYTISPTRFTLEKRVKFAGQTDFFRRHIYQWQR